MVSLAPLGLFFGLLVVATLGACSVVLRWTYRGVQARRQRALDTQTREWLTSVRLPSRKLMWIEIIVGVLGLAAVGCILWGLIEPGTLSVTRHELRSTKLTQTTIRLVQISDLHSEPVVHSEARIVQRIAALKPDLIVFTGDAINKAKGLTTFRQAMTAMARIAPTYSVRGNWETWWFPTLDLYGGTGVHPIDGQARPVTVRGQRIWLFGVGVDHEQVLEKVHAQIPKGEFAILLSHFPFVAPRASKLGVDLQLSGDTHGGQIILPFYGELLRLHRHGIWRKAGLSHEGPMWLYVNRGLGTEGGIPRFRFNCPPEIALFELSPATPVTTP